MLILQTYGFLAIDHPSHPGNDKSQGFQTLGAVKVILGTSTTDCQKNKQQNETEACHYLSCLSIQKGRLQLDIPWLWNEATNVIANGASERLHTHIYHPLPHSRRPYLPSSILLIKQVQPHCPRLQCMEISDNHYQGILIRKHVKYKKRKMVTLLLSKR